MTINELVKLVDRLYENDGLVLEAYRQHTDSTNFGAVRVGDTLAEFIAIELYETFPEDATDESQLEAALYAMDRASAQLQQVVAGLLTYELRPKLTWRKQEGT